MTIYGNASREVSGSSTGEQYIRGESFAGFNVIRFTEAMYPSGAHAAQRLQAESYLDMGYINESAVDTDGRLFEDVDSSRGEHITYHLALDGEGVARASLRMGDMLPGMGLDSLSSYWHTKDVIYDEYHGYIQDFIRINGIESIRDCSAICKGKDVSSLATYATVRDAIQQTLKSKKEELWVMASTVESFIPLKENFGKSFVRSGDNIPPNAGDPRISEATALVPAMSDIRMIPQRLIESIEEALDDTEAQRYVRTLHLVCVGLSDSELSDDTDVVARIRMYLPQ